MPAQCGHIAEVICTVTKISLEMRTAADKQHELIQNFLELRVRTTQLNYFDLPSTQHSSL